MTPEERRKRNYLSVKRYRREQRDRYLALRRKYNAARKRHNPEKVRAENLTCVRRYRALHRDKLLESERKRHRIVTPAYVATLLEIPVSALTPELIEFVRAHLKLKRQLRKMKNENHKDGPSTIPALPEHGKTPEQPQLHSASASHV